MSDNESDTPACTDAIQEKRLSHHVAVAYRKWLVRRGMTDELNRMDRASERNAMRRRKR